MMRDQRYERVVVDRVEELRSFIESKPRDPFPRYALALELKGQGRLEDASREFGELLSRFPEYTAAYLHAGSVLAALERKIEAEEIFRRGIEATGKKGEAHAKSQLETALSDLLSEA